MSMLGLENPREVTISCPNDDLAVERRNDSTHHSYYCMHIKGARCRHGREGSLRS
jgi:hypothetical protein